MSEQEKRERALEIIHRELERCADELESVVDSRGTFERGQALRVAWREHCAEYDRLRRALWIALNNMSPIDLLVEMGLLDEHEDFDGTTGISYTRHEWTPAAHEFAAEMKKSEDDETKLGSKA